MLDDYKIYLCKTPGKDESEMLGWFLAATVADVVVASAIAHHDDVQKQKEANRQEYRNRVEAERQARLEIQKEKELEEYRIQKEQEQLQRQRERLERERTRNKINECITRFAICYYIAMADGSLSPQEKEALDHMCLEIYNAYKYDYVKKTLLDIYNTPNMNMFILGKYLNTVEPSSIATFLSLADEVASIDGNTTDAEKEAVYKIRKYLTDRTGRDYISNTLHLETDNNMECPNCTAPMKIVPYDNKAQCPYCGYFKYLPTKKTADERTDVTVEKRKVRCPTCDALLRFSDKATSIVCPKCRSKIGIVKVNQ